MSAGVEVEARSRPAAERHPMLSWERPLTTGQVGAPQACARDFSERVIPRGVETREIIGIVLLLRDILARSLFKKYQRDFDLFNRVPTPTNPRRIASPTRLP
jgi:hypothetical protein